MPTEYRFLVTGEHPRSGKINPATGPDLVSPGQKKHRDLCTSGQRLALRLTDYDQALTTQRACFVSLHLQSKLRGCIGTLEPQRPLAMATVDAAFNAALADPHFEPISIVESTLFETELSVLSATTPICVSLEAH